MDEIDLADARHHMKPLTKHMAAIVRRIAKHDGGRLDSHGWYDDLEPSWYVRATTNHFAGLVERGLLTPYRPARGERHDLTPDGLAYAVTEGWITLERAQELEAALRPLDTQEPDELGDGGATVINVDRVNAALAAAGHAARLSTPREVAAPAAHQVPRDHDGREIRAGFSVRWAGSADSPTYEADGWSRYVSGEDGWYWLVGVKSDDGGRAQYRAALLSVVEPPAGAPEHATTDELLHLLREAVAGGTGMHPATLSGEDFLTVLALFDELDYRMSRRAYPMPGAWGER